MVNLDFTSCKDLKDMTDEEIDFQYSPSKWSKLYKGDSTAVVQLHVDLVTEASNEVRRLIPNECDIRYGPTENQFLDVFGGDALPNDAPMLVHFHGGYWQALSRPMSSYLVPPLFRKGIRVVVVGYDLTPDVTIFELNEQIKTASTYAMRIATDLGARSISFSGHSAGGQIVMDLLNSEWLTNLTDRERGLIKSLLLISGVFDLVPLVVTHCNDALRLTTEEAARASPMLYKGKEYSDVTVLVIIAEFDTPEYKRQSIEYAQKLSLVNDKVELFKVPKVDHFELVEFLTRDDYTLTKKMIEYILA